MKEDKLERKLTSEINKSTKHGTAALQEGKLEEALKHFESSFKKSLQLGDPFTERACAFNVGAVYISMNKAEQGLAFLQRAIPPSGSRDGKSNGDLYYNFGLGYEVLDNPSEAVKYYELALDEYKEEESNFLMEAEVGKRAGSLYTKLLQWLPASRCFGIAATASSRLGDSEGQTISLCRQASCLYQAGRVKTALQAADECSILCQRVKEEPVLGRLYNELGLTYTQCHEFARAATCFELALPLSRAPHSDRYQEAIILQNLGAVYNSLGDYQRAVPLHEAAILIHAELAQRNSQGQCFQNLAFAYSQMDDHETAGECYLHALQAAKDTSDQHGQWQALEGLGAVAYNEGQYKKASRYFKAAVRLLSTADSDSVALQRLQAKLESALYGSVNGKPDAANRQDSFDIEAMRDNPIHSRMIDKPLGFVPQGFGDYLDENDRAFSRASFRQIYSDRTTSLRGKKEDVVDGAPLEQQGTRHINKTRRMVGTGLDLGRPNKPDAVLSITYEEEIDVHQKPVGHKRKTGGLLREEQHDSEDEWRNNLREIHSSSSSDPDELPYKERRFPNEEVAVRTHRKKKSLMDKFDNEEEWSESYHMSISKKNKKRHSKSSGQSTGQSPIRRKDIIKDENEGESNNNTAAKMTRQEQVKGESNSGSNEEDDHESSAESEESKEKQESTESEDDDDATQNEDHSSEVSNSEKEHESTSRGLAPPLPSVSPLGTTYEQPVQTAEAAPLGANFFRPTTPRKSRSEEQPGQNKADDDEPLYSTLKSVRTLPSDPKEGSSSHTNGFESDITAAPEVPPRRESIRAREYLQVHQEQRNAHLAKRQDTILEEGEVKLPKQKKSSKICAIM